MALTKIQKALLTELESRKDFLRDELSDIETKIDALRDEASPFKVGDVVVAYNRRTRQKEDAQVKEVRYMGWGEERYWYKVSFLKKDGTFGKGVVHAFGDIEAKS